MDHFDGQSFDICSCNEILLSAVQRSAKLTHFSCAEQTPYRALSWSAIYKLYYIYTEKNHRSIVKEKLMEIIINENV